MGKQKTKLGARILSMEELNAILPNAESVYEQIEVFRNNISSERSTQDVEQHEMEQKTNNIGIIGCRGAGKTSILKTFYHKLKSEVRREQEAGEHKENGDIILPIIIPESLSAGMMLMDAVLGRLKSVIEERERAREKNKYQGDCIYSGYDSLAKQYNELVKQYCYIKKDYRDILIQEFTTEQNYVDKTKKVFSSDAEFIRLFHQFVDSLLQDEQNSEKNPMLFLFIDDVDLSADRCTDIVRTLLVYLSHPRIVTFISGDMETFEEELTLEFLRQEGALSADVFQATYCDAEDEPAKNSLLERKKTLAYEYLKKIIPPAYRRTIRYWALEERGNYRIEADRGNASKNLAELLMEVTKDRLDDLYFVYKEDGGQKCMGLAFYMFDKTARGLNNVYNVLEEIYDIQQNEKDMTDGQKTLLLWRLIETMVDSKLLYASYKSELLKKIIVLGREEVKIDFDNAYVFLYGNEWANKEERESKEERENKEGKQNKGEKRERGAEQVSVQTAGRFSPKERFAIFYLMDFAARLFHQDREIKYINLEMRVIQEYISDEGIDGKIALERPLLGCIVNRNKMDDSVWSILIDFLQKCNFVVALHLIRYLGRADIYAILEDAEETRDVNTIAYKKTYDAKTVAYKIAYALLKAGQAVSRSEEAFQSRLAELWIDMQEAMLSLLNQLSLNPWIIYGRRVTANAGIRVAGMRFFDETVYGSDLAKVSFWNVECFINESKLYTEQQEYFLWAEYENRNIRYWIYYEKSLREKDISKNVFNLVSKAREMIAAGLTKTIMDLLQEHHAMKRFEIGVLKEVDYDGILEEKGRKEQREIQVIEQIDKQGLWDCAYVKRTVSVYLNKGKNHYVSEISRGRIIFEATQFVTETYAALAECYKGSSGKAIIYELELKIRRVLFLSTGGEAKEQGRFSDGKYYLRLEQALIIRCLLEEFLDIHWRVYYGKKEARKLLMEVKELPLLPHSEKWNRVDEELRKREDTFFEKNRKFLRNWHTGEVEDSGNWQEIMDKVREEYYGASKKESSTMVSLIKEYLGYGRDVDYGYLQYLVQKRQIERMKEMWNKEPMPNWSVIEPAFPEKDYLFIFHSYLRYLQVNDSDAKNAGVQAEEIARMAQYILDSEIKADEKVQNDFYQTINEELALTEEEFEKLF